MRSKDKAQIMVGIPRDSEMYHFYQEEAKRYGVKLPTFIYQLLRDRYDTLAGKGYGVWFPRGYQASSPTSTAKGTPEEEEPDWKVGTSPQLAVIAYGGEDED